MLYVLFTYNRVFSALTRIDYSKLVFVSRRILSTINDFIKVGIRRQGRFIFALETIFMKKINK